MTSTHHDSITGFDPVRRFSTRALDYSSFRPPYPGMLLHFLAERCGLTAGWEVADLGAGSGRLTEIFLDNGNAVVAVEPNADMRAVAARDLESFSSVTILDAVAESTGLPDGCVDLVVAGSAFHWFDQARALQEALRILRADGWVALIRMTRRVATPFECAYEELLSDFSRDHRMLRERRMEIERRLVQCGFSEWNHVEERSTDVEELLGLTASYSIAPERTDPAFEQLEARLRRLFRRYSEKDRILLGHELRVQYCQAHSERRGLQHRALVPSYWDVQITGKDHAK